MKDQPRNIQDSEHLAELITAVLVYWNENDCFITDSRFSYYKRDELQLDFDTAENLVLNFSENFFPEREELFRFIDGLYDRWVRNVNIKNHYENYIELICEIASYKFYYDIFCLYAYQYEKDIYILEDFYDREEESFSLDKYMTNGEILFQDNEIIFDGLDLNHLVKKTSAAENKEPSKEVKNEVKPLESLLDQYALSKKAKKLTSIFQSLMDLEYE